MPKASSAQLRSLLFVAPAATLVLAMVGLPLVSILWMSAHRVLPVFAINEWVGAGNFQHLVRDVRFWLALRRTFYFAFCAVGLEVLLGLGIALVLSRRFRGRGLVRTLVLLPWALPTVATARMWEWIYNPDTGLLNFALLRLRLLSHPVSWLGDPFWALHAAILADVWKTTPFAALILLAGLASIPRDLENAARVDGAGSARVFFGVTLPLLRPALVVTVLFRFLDSFRAFDSIYVLTGGGPANTTETLALYTYKTFFHSLRFGYASTIALAMFLAAALSSLAIVAFGGSQGLRGRLR
jgi:multiple sugar transport system permease protein